MDNEYIDTIICWYKSASFSFFYQDNSIGNNESIIDSTMTGAYKPLDEGLAADVFIQDTREDIELLEGKVITSSHFLHCNGNEH